MSNSTTRTVENVSLLLAIASLAAVLHACFRIGWMESWLPWEVEYGITSPALILIAALCCWALARWPQPTPAQAMAIQAGAMVLVVVPVLVVLEYLLEVNLGVDLIRSDVFPSVTRPYPGRVSPNAALAVLAVGLAYLLLLRPTSHRARWLLTLALSLATITSVAALFGYVLRIESLYRIAEVNRMLPATAAALSLLCLSLWLIRDMRFSREMHDIDAQEGRIAWRTMLVLMFVAVCAGVTGFAVLRQSLDQVVRDNLSLMATTNATALSNTLSLALWFPKTISTRPAVRDTLQQLQQTPKNAAQLAFLRQVGQSFLTAGVTAVQFTDADGQLLASVGTLTEDEAASRHRLDVAGMTARLFWLNGHVLATHSVVVADGRPVGHVHTEQRLPAFDKLLSVITSANDSSDALVCSLDGDDALCAPSRFYASPVRIPMYKSPGELNLPANRAVAGQTGVAVLTDLRGKEVMAAYVPLAPYGLGFVVKADTRTLFAPLRVRVQLLSALLVIVVAVGTWALVMQVRPLLKQIVQEQRRIRVILDNSNDAFIAIDSRGRITDWNRAAERTFGWSPEAAMGRDLSTLLIPPEQRAIHHAGHQHFVRTGEGPIIGRRVELMALHQGGHQVPIELSVAAHHDGAGFVANAFARDITERKAAEQQLAQSERRMRDITDNVPVLISQFDRDQRIVFTNRYCADIYHTTPEQMLGKTVLDIRGEDGHRQLQPYMARALRGEHVTFESTTVLDGQQRSFQQSYVPNRDADGEVIGFYSVSFDVTDRKSDEQRILASKKRLRDITNNLPVLISYIDTQQRVMFVNATCERWLGMGAEQVIGLTMRDAYGEFMHSEQEPYLRQALAGQRVTFEVESDTLGVRRSLRNEFIPDLAPDGTVIGLYALSTDVTTLKDIERQLSALARYDHLTGLANRYQFNQKLPEALVRALRHGTALALLYLDVDRFKSINDELGHAAGDAVLKEFAERLVKSVRMTDTVVRLAGDEFVVILEDLTDAAQAQAIAQKIIAQMQAPFAVGDRLLTVTTSIGVAHHASGQVSAAELLERADQALYRAKAAGRNGIFTA